jgi:hypothetical protein
MNMCPPRPDPLSPWEAYLRGWEIAIRPEYQGWGESANLLFMSIHALLAAISLAILTIAAYYPCREYWSRIPLRFRLMIVGVPWAIAGALVWFFWIKTADILFGGEQQVAVRLLTFWRTTGIILPAMFALGGSLVLAAVICSEWDEAPIASKAV